MAKSTSLAELPPQSRAAHSESKPHKRTPRTPSRLADLTRRAEAVAQELGALPVKPLLIGAGLGAALLGTALAVNSKRPSSASPFTGMGQTLTKTVLVAVARVVSGQTLRSAASSALLDVADAMKT